GAGGAGRAGGTLVPAGMAAMLPGDVEARLFCQKGSRVKGSGGTAAMMVVGLYVLGCDRKGGDSGAPAGASSQERSVPQAVSAANEKSGGRIFDASLTKKACELLSAERVGQTFGIPAAELKPISAMGCTYRWKSKAAAEAMQLDARFSTIQAHADEASAKQWF